MNYQWIYKKTKSFFFLSIFSVILVFLGDIAYTNYRQYRFEQDKILKRDVMFDIVTKASSIISSNNPSPLFYNTIKRIVIRAPNNSISGYIYSNNSLKLRLENSINLFELSRLFNYLSYKKIDNIYEIQI